jgi:hypothetical protein
VPNEVIKLAFEEARAALKEQDATLGNLRNRATGLLAAASVGTSFAASVGFVNTDPSKGPVFPQWAGWTLLPLTVLIGGAVMAILWPASRWSFGPTATMILGASDKDIDDVHRIATMAMIKAADSNQPSPPPYSSAPRRPCPAPEPPRNKASSGWVNWMPLLAGAIILVVLILVALHLF